MTASAAPSPATAETVRARLTGSEPVLIALDFDGTLTEIVDDPDAPTLTHARRGILARIPAPNRWLAIVSGRALADVRNRVDVDGAIYVGNHGLEIEGPGLASLSPEPQELVQRLSRLLDSLPRDGGVIVENKRLTATLHIRPRADEERRRVLGEAIRPIVEEAGFVLRPGKASWEIRPTRAGTKGDALQRLIEALPGVRPERTLYAGDDVTDEDAFRSLPDGLTVRVGAADAETAARHRVASPEALYALLRDLTA